MREAALRPPERARGRLIVLAFVAAFLAASTSTQMLEASVPWWERISVTIDDKGKQQACTYRSSLSPGGEACGQAMAASVQPRQAEVQSGLFSKLTFERRFSPGPKLESAPMQPGDELIGQQVLFLTIKSDGSIASCRILAKSGEMRFNYGCEQAQGEQFRVPASAQVGAFRQAFMTITAFGHQEQIA